MAGSGSFCPALEMMHLMPFLLLLVTWPAAAWVPARPEVEVLLDVKAALDPHGLVLDSWQTGVQPCSGAFDGVLCDSGDKLIHDNPVNNLKLCTLEVAKLDVRLGFHDSFSLP